MLFRSIDVKAFTMSNSEKIYTGLIDTVNTEVATLILGSTSMAGATQSYVGSTKAHQDVFRDRIEVYREYVENNMNELIIPRLVKMGYLSDGLEFKYSNRLEMSNKDKISLYAFLTDRYEVQPDEIDKEFGVSVGKQLNIMAEGAGGPVGPGEPSPGGEPSGPRRMNDDEYYRRYGRTRASANFLTERG